MCGMRYGKHTPMPRMLPKSSNSRQALADEARRSGSHGILHRDARFVTRARSQLQRGMGVHG
ncbi:hypothetical protein CK203_066423 [Vitis vinifera]|uniref:Uncharacterized protein n=1 Tax=Vitis vinifera TaxID=29760 RepID=A0A438G2K7_VITVI|nr:hypothetical protein CK203_066423 [Vitis vinifera]